MVPKSDAFRATKSGAESIRALESAHPHRQPMDFTLAACDPRILIALSPADISDAFETFSFSNASRIGSGKGFFLTVS